MSVVTRPQVSPETPPALTADRPARRRTARSGWRRTRCWGWWPWCYIYPFLIQVATSFKTDPDAAAHPLSLVPNPFDLTAWKRMFGLTADASVPVRRGWATRSWSRWS